MTDAAAAAAHLRELGEAYRDRDPVGAEDALQRSLQLAPGVPDTHVALARVLVRLNRFAEADSHLRRALAIDPHHDGATALRAELLVAEGLVPEAISCFLAAADNGASARTLAGFGDLLARLGLRADAAARYREALARGSDPEALANLALIDADAGRLEEALAGLERALELAPGSPEIRLNRANVLVELGRCDEAERAYRALQHEVDVAAAALWGLAAVLDGRGDTAGAADARERACALEPELARRCAPLGARV